jgi:hypothetical protein
VKQYRDDGFDIPAKGFRSFEACFLFPPLVGQSRENAPPVSIVEISIETCGFFFSTDR